MRMIEKTDKVKIFIPTDESLKQLGELLMTKTSRLIILELVGKEMYVNELAIKLKLRVSLVTHHLEKLVGLGLLDIVNKPISRKTKNHRFFRFKTDIFLDFTEDLDGNKLKRIFKDGVRFASIGIVAFTSFLFDYPSWFKSNESNYAEPFESNNPLVSWIIFLTILVIGLVIERIYIGIKKRRKN